jgi:hypothetical protein
MSPAIRTCGMRLIVLASALAWAGTAVQAQPVPIARASFVNPPTGESPDGRLHLTLAVTVHSGGIVASVESVRWQDGGIVITVAGRLPDNGYLQPAVTIVNLPLTVDNAPPGRYPLRLRSHIPLDEETVAVAATRRTVFPLDVRVWPPDPTPFDSIWLLVDIWNQCHGLQAPLNGPNWFGVARELPRLCQIPVLNPRLAMAELGPQLHAPEAMQLLGPNWFMQLATPPFQLTRRLTPRLNGGWFDPAHPGHGINVEVVDRGTLLVQWLTFDADGNPMWIVGAGPHADDSAVLQAHTVTGGRFPPQFDPNQAQAQPWGTLWIQFLSCERARMDWQSAVPGGVAGSMPLHRLVGADGPACAQPPPDAMLEPAWYQGPGSYFRLPDPG